MQDEEQFFHWLEVPDNAPILFEDLPWLLAEARNPDRSTFLKQFEASASQLNFEQELPQAVRRGRLVVRDPLTGTPQSSPIGAALKRAVVFPLQDLRPFLAELGMGVRIREKAPESEPVQREKDNPPVARFIAGKRVAPIHAQRSNLLTAIIEQAIQQAGSDGTALVWAELEAMANQNVPPFIGASEGELKYLDGGETKFLRRKNLGDRLERRAKALAKAPR